MSSTSNAAKAIVATLGIGLMAAACERRTDDTYPRATQTAREMGREVREAAREVGQGAREAAREVGQGTREATREVGQEGREATREVGQEGREAARTGTVVPVTMAFNDALNSIAASRCEHEQRCGNVGTGKRYESMQACRTVVRNDFADDLNASECPRGIDRQELAECVQEVREETCNNPLDTLSRVAACRTSDMCRATNVSML